MAFNLFKSAGEQTKTSSKICTENVFNPIRTRTTEQSKSNPLAQCFLLRDFVVFWRNCNVRSTSLSAFGIEVTGPVLPTTLFSPGPTSALLVTYDLVRCPLLCGDLKTFSASVVPRDEDTFDS